MGVSIDSPIDVVRAEECEGDVDEMQRYETEHSAIDRLKEFRFETKKRSFTPGQIRPRETCRRESCVV